MALRQWELVLRVLTFAALSTVAAVGFYALIGTFVWTPAEVAAGAPYRALGLAPQHCSGCVLCGMGRAFSCVARGDWSAASAYNSLVVVVYPGVVALTSLSLLAIAALLRRPLRLVAPAQLAIRRGLDRGASRASDCV